MPGGGNVSEIFLLPEYADKINASWRKTTESILETARLCADANKDLKSKDRARLIKQLAFNAATFSKLVKIGSKYQLQQDPVKSLLPPSYSIVYEVAKLNEGDLQVAVTEGVINPGMTRRDLDAWIGKNNPKMDASKDQIRPKVIATVQVPPDYDVQKQGLLEKALEKRGDISTRSKRAGFRMRAKFQRQKRRSFGPSLRMRRLSHLMPHGIRLKQRSIPSETATNSRG
jgi:hypothetical protein